MSFTQAVRTCLGKYATFGGRASRAEYWWFALFTTIAVAATGGVDASLGTGYLYCLTLLALFVPLLAAGSRRLHDGGRTGWLNLIVLVPGVGGLVLTVLLLLRGDEGSNQYGEPYMSPEQARMRAETAAFHYRPADQHQDVNSG